MRKVALPVFVACLTAGMLSAQDHFVPVWTGNGLDHMNFYITAATVDGVNLSAGDEIAVFDGTYCVGAVRLTEPISGYVEIRASKDEEDAGINGYTEGHAITYKFWDSTENAEYADIVPSYVSGTGLFEPSGTASLSLSLVLNQAPVADAGVDQDVNEGDIVTLDGTASSDADGDSLGFSWTAPAGIVLSDNASINPTFTAPEVLADTIYSFTLTVNDGMVDSGTDTVKVTVRNQNKIPVITGQIALSTNEETGITLILSNFTITDGDNDTADMTLVVSDGADYSRTGNMITPAVNYTGTLTVPVRVTDGIDTSVTFNASVTVNSINDAPVITGQIATYNINEETPFTVHLADIAVTDPDNTWPDEFILTVFDSTNYSVSNDSLVTPDSLFSGTLSIPVQVSDGSLTSNIFILTATILAVDDPPVITGQVALAYDEDTPFPVHISDLSITDPDNTPADFSVSVSDSVNYSVTDTTVTPDQDFTGTLYIPVTVSDGTLSSSSFVLSVTITAVNDAPVIDTVTTVYSVPEDTPFVIRLSDLTVSDPDNTWPDDFTLVIADSINYSVSGDSLITPDTDFQGALSIPVYVSDGSLNSNIWIVTASIGPANDPPLITGQNPYSYTEDIPFTLQPGDLLITDPDNMPADFTLTVYDSTSYTLSGTTVTPTANNNATLYIPVSVSDGQASSNRFVFTATGVVVNDAPAITGQSAVVIKQDSSFILLKTHLTIVDPDNLPADFTLSVTDSINYSVSGTTVTPDAGFSGTLYIPVTVSDGNLSSSKFIFTATVVPKLTASYTKTDVTIPGGHDGSIDLTVSGGAPSYSYNWSTGAFTQDISFLYKGIYTVTINDAGGQSLVISVEIKEQQAQTCDITVDFTYEIEPITQEVSLTVSTTEYEYYWTFGDGAVSAIASPTHIYSYPGLYQVCLSAYDDLSDCSVEVCKMIEVGSPECIADYTFYIDATDSLLMHFSDNSIGAVSVWYWNFSDGSISTSQNVDHRFTKPGTYQVCLYTLDNASGCLSEACRNITIGSVPLVADFTSFINPATLKVTFTNISSGVITDYYWTYGDGMVYSGKDSSHTYQDPGIYTVCLSVRNKNTGRFTEKCKVLKVGTLPCSLDAAYSYFIDPVTRKVNFTNLTSGTVHSRFWNFGDGTSSSRINPIHQFTRAGYYLISLSVRDTITNCTDSHAELIQVGQADCKALFNYSIDPASLTVSFEDNSLGRIKDHFWTLGDGYTSTYKDPVHQYSNPGLYQVSLTITDSSGICMDNLATPIQVGYVDCSADFTVFVDSLTNIAYFTNQSLGRLMKYYWIFSDGKMSTEKNPVHQFPFPGYQKVSLNTFNELSGCMDYKEKIILIGTQGTDCQADFIYQTDEATNTVSFADRSLGEGLTWFWNFGDGNTSQANNPLHQYSRGGVFNVCLTVYSTSGVQNTSCKQVFAGAPATGNCLAQFIYTVNNDALLVNYSDKSFGEPDHWYWEFGDNSTSGLRNPVNIFAEPGYYTTRQQIMKQSTGCISDAFALVSVNMEGGLIAGFGYTIDSTALKAESYPVDYVGVSLGDASKYKWSFGDGSYDSTTTTPTHIYSAAGNYEVCLTIYDDVSGAENTTCSNVVVGSPGFVSYPFEEHGIGLHCYPNPSDDLCYLVFDIPASGYTELTVYSITGNKLRSLVNKPLVQGRHIYEMNSSGWKDGMYLVRLQTASGTVIQKLTIQH